MGRGGGMSLNKDMDTCSGKQFQQNGKIQGSEEDFHAKILDPDFPQKIFTWA
jgi:hypothetical protein